MKKTIQAVDLFCGAGGTSTGLIQAAASSGKKIKLTAINHWDKAIATHKANHPEVRHLCENIDNVNPRTLFPEGRIQLLIASPECFPKDTLILTDIGILPIQDIRIGQKVLTHKGRWRAVTNTMRSIKDTVIIKGQGHYGLETTNKHPFYIRERNKKWNNAKRSYFWYWNDPSWMETQHLYGCNGETARRKELFWATPVKFESLPIPIVGGRGMPFTSEFWWIIGRWLGDGSIRIRSGVGSEITISCGKHDAKFLSEKLNNFGVPSSKRAGKGELRWREREVRTAVLFETGHNGLANWIVENFGKLAHGKTIPTWVFGMKKEWRQSLLDGYISADGHASARRIESSSVSKKLTLGIRLLAESLGERVSLNYQKPRNDHKIEGRQVNCRAQYRAYWNKTRIRRNHMEASLHSWMRIRDVLPGSKGITVYNLSIDEDESYIADGIVVHNCTHHSNARGGTPCSDQSRATAWRVVDWANALYIDNILIENVPEFESWGPLGVNGRPLKSMKGKTFQAFKVALESLGYRVEHRVLNAADYGDPTCRKRLFLIARRGNKKIKWPEPTHTENGGAHLFGETKQWVPAKNIIDWSIHGQSIFIRKKPLAEKTLARIEYGLKKFGGEDFLVKFFGTGKGVSLSDPLPTVTATGNHFGVCEPFITIYKGKSKSRSIDDPMPTLTTKSNMYLCEPFLTRFHGGQGSEKRVHDVDGPLPVVDTSNRYGLVEPFIIPQFGERNGQKPRNHSLNNPLPTITSHGAGALVEPFILPQHQGSPKQLRVKSIKKPLSTITTTGAEMLIEPFMVGIDHASAGKKHVRSLDKPAPTVITQQNYALIQAFLIKYFGTGKASSLDKPLDTITTKDRFGLVEIFEKTPCLDIRLRMLQPHELAAAQSFPKDYEFTGNKGEIVKQIGNAVPRRIARALCRELIK